MNELDEIRDRIDSIDSRLAALFESRMVEVEKIARIKSAGGLPVTDLEREEVIRTRNAALIGSDSIRPYFVRLYDSVLSLSKEYQSEINEKQHRD